MPESSATDPKLSSGASKAPTSASSHGSGNRQLPSWLTLAALVIAVVAVALAVVGWFRPATGPGKFSGQEAQDAKGRICEVTGTVRQATSINTNMTSPVPGDAVAGLAIAANARLALYAGGGYVLQRLAEEPATPADLAKAATAMANTMQELGINYLAGASADSPMQQPLRDNLSTQLADLDTLCQ